MSAVMEKLDANVASVLDAFMEGMRAGKMFLSPSLNPFTDEASSEFHAWERGRSSAVAIRLAGEVS